MCKCVESGIVLITLQHFGSKCESGGGCMFVGVQMEELAVKLTFPQRNSCGSEQCQLGISKIYFVANAVIFIPVY